MSSNFLPHLGLQLVIYNFGLIERLDQSDEVKLWV